MGRTRTNEGANSRARTTSFAARLRRAREFAGLSQEELAERAGLTANAIGALERGERRHPYPATIRALADAIGLSADDRAALAASVPRRGEEVPVSASPRFQLPVALSPLIGRVDEVAGISTLLRRDGVRLVTLTGPGGVGKTSLALRVASDLENDFADGAAFVPLAAVRDPTFVASAVAQAIGVSDTGTESFVVRIGEFLRDRQFLLIVDNFEHVLGAAPLLTELLARCEGLVVLATSRSPLRLAGEYDVSVAPLALADPQLSDPAQIARAAAVQLFAERARAADATFALTAENTAAVAAICHRLDGLPLAIELAAARSRLFPPAAFLARLALRLPLLTAGRRDAPHRHQTMRNAIAWSHDLLTPAEQTLFRRLAIFAGGFTLDAAEAVCVKAREIDSFSPSRLPASSPSVLDGVATLVDQRLVFRIDSGIDEPCYTMLETIREFAVDQLNDCDEVGPLRDAHAVWCRSLVDEAAPHWFTPGQSPWADRLEFEHDNVRTALAYALETDRHDFGLRLVSQLWPFWIVRGHISEGWRWIEKILASDEGAPTIERMRILTGAARFVRYLGEGTKAKEIGEEALSIAEEIGESGGIDAAFALVGLAHTAASQRDFTEAVRLNERALAILRPLRDFVPRAAHLECLTFLYLANIVLEFDDDDRATNLASAALAHCRQFDWDWGELECLCCLVPLACRRGDLATASLLCREGLNLAMEQRDPWPIIMFLDAFGIIAGAANRAALGARLIGAADRYATSLQLRAGYVQYHGRDRGIAVLRKTLGDAAFATQLAEGRAVSLDEAIADALDLADQIALEFSQSTR